MKRLFKNNEHLNGAQTTTSQLIDGVVPRHRAGLSHLFLTQNSLLWEGPGAAGSSTGSEQMISSWGLHLRFWWTP